MRRSVLSLPQTEEVWDVAKTNPHRQTWTESSLIAKIKSQRLRLRRERVCPSERDQGAEIHRLQPFRSVVGKVEKRRRYPKTSFHLESCPKFFSINPHLRFENTKLLEKRVTTTFRWEAIEVFNNFLISVARREYYGNLVTMRYGEYVEWKKEQRPQTSRKSQESLRSPSLDELPVEPSLVQVESDTSSEIVEDVERKMSESLPALSPKPSPRSSMDDRTPSDLLMGMSPLTTPGEEGSVTVEPLPIKSHRSGKKTKGDTLQLQEIYQQRRDMRLANMKRVVEAKRNQGKNKEKEEVESVQSELDQTNPEQNTFVENSTKS